MADNITLNSGSNGSDLRTTEDASAKHHQHVILELDDGTTSPVALVGGAGAVAGGVQRVTLASDDPGVALLGTIDTDTGSISTAASAIQTAVELADDCIFADDAAFTLASSKVSMSGAIRDDALSTLTAVEADAVPLRVGSTGALWTTISGTVTVDGSGATQPVSGTVTANLSATDNAVLDQLELNTSYGDSVGGGTEAAALRVTIANDSTGVLSVDDGGGALTVDGTVTANLSATDNAVLDAIAASVAGTLTVSGTVTADAGTNLNTSALALESGGNLATVAGAIFADDAAFTLASSSVAVAGAVRDDTLSTLTAIEGDAVPLRVSSTGALHVTGGGGGTEYTEDAAAAGDPTGNAVILVRADTPGAVTSTDGDNIAQRATNYGAAFCQILDSSGNFIDTFGGSGGTSHADDAAFSIGSASSITPTGYLADETTPDSVDEGDVGVPRMTLTRKPYAVIANATGEDSATVTANGDIQVTLDGEVITSFVVGADAENAAATNNPVQVAGRYDATPRTLGDGDVGGIALDADGAVHVSDGGNALTVDNAALSVTGGGTESGALRVTVANDSTGVVSIDDGGGTITVDSNGFTTIADKLTPNTSNGASTYLNQDTSAIASVKGSGGSVYWIACMSTASAPVYLNLYNSTTAVLGTTTPTNQFIVPSQGDANGAGFTINFGQFGIQYGTGIQVACATTFDGSADPGTNAVICNIGYE